MRRGRAQLLLGAGAALIAAWLGGCDASRAATRVALWIGGDVHLGRDATSGAGLEAVTAGLEGPGIVNLEGAAGPWSAPPPALVNAPEVLPGLRAAGVRLAVIANNHARDLGPAAPLATAGELEAASIAPVGGPAGRRDLRLGGSRVAVTAHDLGNGVPPELAADIGAAARSADLVVAIFHVTGPPSYVPRPELERAVRVAVAAGARVVAAIGTHVLGPVERRGDAVIAWGLGNLRFACDCTRSNEGLILAVSLDGDGALAAEVVPVDAGLGGEPARGAADPQLTYDLLEAIGSAPLARRGQRASL